MSCVAALVEDGKIYMAADTFLGWAERRLPRSKDDGKAFRHASGLLIGSTGTSSAARRLRSLTLPSFGEVGIVDDYVLEVLGPAMAHHVGDRENFEFLVGIDGRLFQGFSNGVAIEVVEGFTAIGSGGSYALGSLATSTGDKPAGRVRRAVQIAERYVPTVRSPIVSLSGRAATKIPGREERRSGVLDRRWRSSDGVVSLDEFRAA